MIKNFKCKETEKLFNRKFIKKLPRDIQRVALRKLKLLDAVTTIDTLKGSRKGQHSIRINDQWRICFVWKEGNAFEVEIIDYH